MSNDAPKKPAARRAPAKKAPAKKAAARKPAAKTPRKAPAKPAAKAAAKAPAKDLTTSAGEVVTARQRTELVSGLRAGGDLDLAATAAGIEHVEALLEDDPELMKKVKQESARAEIRLLRKLGQTRPAFVLERTRPELYAPSRHRELPGEDDADELDRLASRG